MTPDLISQPDYRKLIDAVAKEIAQGTARIQQAYKAEIVRTTWNVGRIITENIDLDNMAPSQKAVMIAGLVKEFKKSESYFYKVIKFYQLYPVLPRTNLTWEHYSNLLSVQDPRERRRLEFKASRDGISAKDFRVLVSDQRKTAPLVVIGPNKTIKYVRGRLYHYAIKERTPEQVADNRVILDIGFSIDRRVAAPKDKGFHAGLMVRAAKKGDQYHALISSWDKDRLYTYQAKVKRVIDGDTLLIYVDLGFSTFVTHTVRLRAIDAPEINSILGRKAKNFVQDLIDQNPWVVIKTYKDDKYGRFLVDVFTGSKEQDSATIAQEGTYLNQLLVDKGLAVL